MHAAPLPDGRFDLAVNGGGRLTLNVRRDGFLPAQRWIDVPWQDYLVVDDIALVQRDVQTTVDPTLPAPMQVARGSVQTDDDGTRRATLLVPQGTTAQMVMPKARPRRSRRSASAPPSTPSATTARPRWPPICRRTPATPTWSSSASRSISSTYSSPTRCRLRSRSASSWRSTSRARSSDRRTRPRPTSPRP